MLLAAVCAKLISWVRYPTQTETLAAETVTIFIIYYFNLNVLLLLSNADLSRFMLTAWIPIRGPFPDMTEQWYLVIAPQIVLTMTINMF